MKHLLNICNINGEEVEPENSKKIILDLCGGTGSWSSPYKEAGYDVRIVTLPEHDVCTYKPPDNVYGVLAATPCDEFSIAKHFHGKGNYTHNATDNQADIDRYLENDCDFSFCEDEELYTATLHNADGDALEVEDDANGFEDMVVAIEFSGLREARP